MRSMPNSEIVTPDSSKSTFEKTKESVTDTTDKAARAVVPDDQKGTGQQISDKAGRSKDDAKDESIMDKTKHALGLDKK